MKKNIRREASARSSLCPILHSHGHEKYYYRACDLERNEAMRNENEKMYKKNYYLTYQDNTNYMTIYQ